MKKAAILLAFLLAPVVASATISSTASTVSFTCTNSTGPFPFTFPVMDAGSLRVIDISSGALPGVMTVLTSSQWNSTPVNASYKNGGNVTLVSACPAGDTLVIARSTELTQTTAFTPYMPALYASTENGLDQLTMGRIDSYRARQVNAGKITGGGTVSITDTPLGQFVNINFPYDGSGNPLCPAGCTLTGPLNAPQVNSEINVTMQSGADIGAQANTTSTLASNGIGLIPRGTYSYTTPISFATQQCMTLQGQGAAGNGSTGGTVLTYTGTTGNAYTDACQDSTSGNYVNPSHGLRDLSLFGTGAAGVTGIYLGSGSTSATAESAEFKNVYVGNFATAIQEGSNAWAWHFNHASIWCLTAGQKCYDSPSGISNSGETNVFDGGTYFVGNSSTTNCVNIASGEGPEKFSDVSFDNCPINVSSGIVLMSQVHMEYPGEPSTVPMFTSAGSATTRISGMSVVYASGSTGTVPPAFISISGSNTTLHVDDIWLYGTGSTPVPLAFSVNTGATLFLGCVHAVANVTALVGGDGTGHIIHTCPSFYDRTMGGNPIGNTIYFTTGSYGRFAWGTGTYFDGSDIDHIIRASVNGTQVLTVDSTNLYSSTLAADFKNGYKINSNTVLPPTVNGYQGVGTKIFLPSAGAIALVAGTVTVSNVAACAPSSSCIYKLARCGTNGSTAVGVPSIGSVTPGTSFVINSYSSTNTVVTGDTALICWQIN